MIEVFTITQVGKSTTSTGKEQFSIKTDKGWMSGFMEDWDGNPTPGAEVILVAPLPIRAKVEWKESKTLDRDGKPYLNVQLVDTLGVDEPNEE